MHPLTSAIIYILPKSVHVCHRLSPVLFLTFGKALGCFLRWSEDRHLVIWSRCPGIQRCLRVKQIQIIEYLFLHIWCLEVCWGSCGPVRGGPVCEIGPAGVYFWGQHGTVVYFRCTLYFLTSGQVTFTMWMEISQNTAIPSHKRNIPHNSDSLVYEISVKRPVYIIILYSYWGQVTRAVGTSHKFAYL